MGPKDWGTRALSLRESVCDGVEAGRRLKNLPTAEASRPEMALPVLGTRA